MLQHVVVVTDGLIVDGGTAKVALESAAALAESGLRVTVFGAYGEASRELAGHPNVRIVSTGQTHAMASRNPLADSLRLIWNRRAHAKMTELLATLDPATTIVHVHCWTKALSSSVVAAVARAKFPMVMTLHEYFTACPTGCLYLHRDRKVCTLTPMSVACIVKNCDSRSYLYKAYRVVRQLVQRTFGRIPSGIGEFITVSEFSRSVIERYLPRRRRVHPIANPVPAERATRVPAEASDTFVFIGRLSPEKGGVLLAEAARSAGVKVTFVGDGPEREAILQANPDARITGWLDGAGVSAELRAARCVVVPSLWYETFGLVVLEAAALGVPAIAPEDTAVRDLIVPGASGVAFERGNAQALAAALRAFSDDAAVERMSQGAYDAFWSNPPSMSAHVERLLATYRDVLAATARASAGAGVTMPVRAS